MVQIIAIGLVGVLVWYVFQAFRKEVKKANGQLREEELSSSKQIPLEKGKDGVYRPKREDQDGQ